MRAMIIGAAALLLSACGGETYPIPAGEVFSSLSSIGSSPLEPLPAGLDEVDVAFESVPREGKVRWLFTHEGEDLARIEALVAPGGANASTVTISYVAGAAPDGHWRNGEARRLIQKQFQRLIVEAVDSTLEHRPFDEAMKRDVALQVAAAVPASLAADARSPMKKTQSVSDELEKQAEIARVQLEAARAQQQVGKPMTDFGGGR